MISASAQGDWRLLEGKLRPFIARRVPGNDVDDVLQDVFLRMQRGLAHLRDDERFGPWVYRLAASAVVDHLRAAARPTRDRALAEPGLLEDAAGRAEPDSDDDGAAERALALNLVPFVAALPSPYREALTLTELEGLTQKEAAAMLGVSLSGMKSRVQRGRERLRQALENCCHIALDARGRVMGYAPRKDAVTPPACCAESRPQSSSDCVEDLAHPCGERGGGDRLL